MILKSPPKSLRSRTSYGNRSRTSQSSVHNSVLMQTLFKQKSSHRLRSNSKTNSTILKKDSSLCYELIEKVAENENQIHNALPTQQKIKEKEECKEDQKEKKTDRSCSSRSTQFAFKTANKTQLPIRIAEIEGKVDELLKKKINLFAMKKIEEIFACSSYSELESQLKLFIQSIKNIRSDEQNEDLHANINEIYKKIQVIQNIIAQNYAESEMIKRRFLERRAQRKALISSSASKIKQLSTAKSDFDLYGSAYLNKSSVFLESRNQISYKKPHRQAYNIYKHRHSEYEPNKQPIGASSYQMEYIQFGKIKNIVCKPQNNLGRQRQFTQNSHSKVANSSIYKKDFSPSLFNNYSKFNYCEMDGFKDKIKNLPISFTNTSKKAEYYSKPRKTIKNNHKSMKIQSTANKQNKIQKCKQQNSKQCSKSQTIIQKETNQHINFKTEHNRQFIDHFLSNKQQINESATKQKEKESEEHQGFKSQRVKERLSEISVAVEKVMIMILINAVAQQFTILILCIQITSKHPRAETKKSSSSNKISTHLSGLHKNTQCTTLQRISMLAVIFIIALSKSILKNSSNQQAINLEPVTDYNYRIVNTIKQLLHSNESSPNNLKTHKTTLESSENQTIHKDHKLTKDQSTLTANKKTNSKNSQYSHPSIDPYTEVMKPQSLERLKKLKNELSKKKKVLKTQKHENRFPSINRDEILVSPSDAILTEQKRQTEFKRKKVAMIFPMTSKRTDGKIQHEQLINFINNKKKEIKKHESLVENHVSERNSHQKSEDLKIG